MTTIDLARVRAGDALLARANELFNGRQRRAVPIEEIESMAKQYVFTPDEAAELLQTTPATIRKWIREGRLNAAKIGKTYRIDRAQLSALWRDMGGIDLFNEGDNDE